MVRKIFETQPRSLQNEGQIDGKQCVADDDYMGAGYRAIFPPKYQTGTRHGAPLPSTYDLSVNFRLKSAARISM
jgi:hypothetical protein